MIKLELTFDSYTDLAVAIAHLAGGARVLTEVRSEQAADLAASTALTSGTVDSEATETGETKKRTRRTKEQIAADEAAKLAAEAKPAVVEETAALVTEEPKPAAEAEVDPFSELDNPIAATASPSTFEERFGTWQKTNAGKSGVDFLRAELQRVNTKSGMEGCRKLMVDFGYPRISETPPEKFAALLATIDQAAA